MPYDAPGMRPTYQPAYQYTYVHKIHCWSEKIPGGPHICCALCGGPDQTLQVHRLIGDFAEDTCIFAG